MVRWDGSSFRVRNPLESIYEEWHLSLTARVIRSGNGRLSSIDWRWLSWTTLMPLLPTSLWAKSIKTTQFDYWREKELQSIIWPFLVTTIGILWNLKWLGGLAFGMDYFCQLILLFSLFLLLFSLFLLLFTSPIALFNTIHEFYYIISANFYIYLQYFQ